jgi:hypothetical protein
MTRHPLAVAAAAAGICLAMATASLAADAPSTTSPPPPASNDATMTAAPATNAPIPADGAPPVAASAPAAANSASDSVVVYIAPEITNRKWSNQSVLFRPIFLVSDQMNNVGKVVTDRITTLVATLSPDAKVVTSPASSGGAKFYIVPTIKRLDQISGMFAWDDLSYVIELEWRVTDQTGAVVLLDTAKGEAKGKFGTSFTATSNAERIEGEMLDQAMAQSATLLKPILAGQH